MKRALFIGGTGVISSACVKLALEKGFDVTLLNRGNSPAPDGARVITCDAGDEDGVRQKLFSGGDGGGGGGGVGAGGGGSAGGKNTDGLLGSALRRAEWGSLNRDYDIVADFIAYRPEQAERDLRLFSGRVGQYIFISTTAAYQKPLGQSVITESTPLYNPYWQYARDKIKCEQILMDAYRESGFPVTIVRPSHTYSEKKVPVAVHGRNGSWQILKRIIEGKPVIVHGDGLTWWTFTYNSDFAVGFTGLMGNPHAIGEAVHITSDEKLTWNASYHVLGGLLGREPVIANISSQMLMKFDPSLEGPLLGDKANSVNFDNTKIKRLVPEYTATTRFDQGARIAVEYTFAHKELQIEDPEFDAFCDKVIGFVS
jgi:nucleoside-diphosphate-sugar epimerase